MNYKFNRSKFILVVLSATWLMISVITNSSLTIIPYVLLVSVCLFKRNDYFSPMIFLFIPWSFALTMFYSSMIIYEQKRTDILPTVYIILCLIIIWAGFGCGEKIILRKKGHTNSKVAMHQKVASERNIIKLITIMSLFGVIGSLLGIVDLIYLSGIDKSSIILMRESYMTKQSNLVAQTSNVLSWMSLSVVPSFFFVGRQSGWINKLIWSLSLGLYIVESMFTAGRQVVFSISIMLIVSYLIRVFIHPKKNISDNRRTRRETKRYKRIIVFGGVLAACYMFFIATARTNKRISSTKIGVLKYYFEFSCCDWMNKVIDFLPIGLADGLVEGLVYFTHQIGEFTVFWNIPTIGPFWGLYSFPFIDRRLSFLHLSFSMEDKLTYVRSYMKSQGVMPVGWKTAFSYYILDYGRIGALIFCFILGVIAKKIYMDFRRNRTFFSAFMLIMANVYMFYTIMMPATCETALFFMIIFSLVMWRIEKGNDYFRFVIE